MDTKTLKQKLTAKEPIVVIDVREEAEVKEGMIPGAIWIPLNTLNSRLNELPKDKKIILYCASGGRSGFACMMLKEMGYDVENLDGGMCAYK